MTRKNIFKLLLNLLLFFILKLPEKIIMNYYEKYKPRMNELEAFNMVNLRVKHIELDILLDLNRVLSNFIVGQAIYGVFLLL